ncbi:MAG: lysophospholipid acyltransferase family protein [Candidatus Sumerlaeaceae bacterium]
MATKPKRKRLISRDTEQWLAHRVGVPFAYHVISQFKRTWRIERVNGERALTKPCIFAIYHGDLIVGAYELPNILPNVDVLTSRSRDGTLVARFVHMFRGARTIRGSSSKGGTGALLQMRRSVMKGRAVVIPIDGPRGPEGSVKPGVIAIASQSGVPIIPGAVLCDQAWRFRSWDRMMIAKPFARVRIVFGEQFLVEPDLDRPALEAKRAELEAIMREMHS